MEEKIIDFDDVDLIPIILYIPKGTMGITIDCKVDSSKHGDISVKRILKMNEIYDAMIDGEYYDCEHAVYTLNKEKIAELEDES